MTTYLIPECNLAELESRVEKLNRRCRKLGLSEITLVKTPDHVRHLARQLTTGQEIGGPSTKTNWIRLSDGIKTVAEESAKMIEAAKGTGAYLAGRFTDEGQVMTWWSVNINGEKPSLSDWTFVAVLEPMTTEDGETLNLVQCLPGETCPSDYRERIGECDHCKAKRLRKQTFVVRHTDGNFKCVGRQCIKDFLGYNADPHNLASAAELMAELESLCDAAGDDEWLGGGSGRSERYWDLRFFLTWTACRIRLSGWLGRGKAREMREEGRKADATADMVLEILTPPTGMYATDEEKRKWAEFVAKHVQTDEDAIKAESAVEWAKSIPATDLEGNNYLENVNLIARCGTTGRKTAGIAASILVAYDRAMEKEIKRVEAAARPESNWIGQVGDKLVMLQVTCNKVILSDGVYGVTGIHKMTDVAGNDLTWFASGGRVMEEGETVTINASIKKLDEYKGRKQTILTRCTVWTEEGLAAAKAKAEKKAAREAKKAAKTATV